MPNFSTASILFTTRNISMESPIKILISAKYFLFITLFHSSLLDTFSMKLKWLSKLLISNKNFVD